MKEIAAHMFDAFALSLPQGLAFGNTPPVGAWISEDRISCGVLTRSVLNGSYGVIVMRRRVDDVWCVLSREDSFTRQPQAMAVISGHLEGQSSRVPLPAGARRRPPLSDITNVIPSEIFKSLLSPSRRIGCWMLNQLYLALPNPDPNWASDCQTGNFHTRLWEAHLLASFREQGLSVTQEHSSPDFHVSNRTGGEAWVEAVTANPQERYEHFGAEPVLPPADNRERNLGPAAARFAKTIRSKLDKKYQNLPHVAGKPLILALADFHAPSSMLWSRESLICYLYGVFAYTTERDGVQVAVAEEVKTLLCDIPSGLFRSPENAHLSAIIFTNACTIPKLSRVPISGGAHLEGYRYVRIGEFFDRTPGALRGIPFSMDIASEEYRSLWPVYGYEPWSAEIEVFHNPLASHPIPNNLFPEVTHWRETNGTIACQSYFETAILRSRTLVLDSSAKVPTVEDLLKGK